MKVEFISMGPANGTLHMVFRSPALASEAGRFEMLSDLERASDSGSWIRTPEPLSSTRAVAILKYKGEAVKVRFNEDRMALFPAGERDFDARALIESLPGNEPDPVELVTPREYFGLDAFIDHSRNLIKQGRDRDHFEAMTRARECWKAFGHTGTNGDFHKWLDAELPKNLLEDR